MNKPVYIAVLAVMLLALCVLVPSPALVEEGWKTDPSQLRTMMEQSYGSQLTAMAERAHEEYQRADGGARKPTQRMVIAQDGPLSDVMVCCEGPDNEDSKGLTLEEMGQFMLDLGVETAYNLDGGGSTAVAFQGGKINVLDTSKNRSVSDIIYFCTGVAK